jgi:hypothetical protein
MTEEDPGVNAFYKVTRPAGIGTTQCDLTAFDLNSGDVLATGSDIESAAGGGARAITVAVQDEDDNALQNATVRFTAAGVTYAGPISTSSLGTALVGLDDGDYTLIVTKAGYTYTPTTQPISADGTIAVTMIANTVTLPADPEQSLGILVTKDGQGSAKPNVPVVFKMVKGPGDAGLSFDGDVFTITSDGNGEFSADALFVRGAKYEGQRGTGRQVIFTVPDASSFNLPEVLGVDSD